MRVIRQRVTAKAPMVAAQNDIYMVVSDAKSNPENDDVEECFMQEKLLWENCRGMLPISWGFLLKKSFCFIVDRQNM
mgnify:CR=1 FL=1